jgi:hypothetical protein
MTRILADFMTQTIQRRLGEGVFRYQRQIDRASGVHDLLPLLEPLIDALVTRAGPEVGAEFASTAAFILNPQQRDTAL